MLNLATTSEKRAKTKEKSIFLAKEISSSKKQGKYFLPVIKKHSSDWQLSARQFWQKAAAKEGVLQVGSNLSPETSVTSSKTNFLCDSASLIQRLV